MAYPPKLVDETNTRTNGQFEAVMERVALGMSEIKEQLNITFDRLNCGRGCHTREIESTLEDVQVDLANINHELEQTNQLLSKLLNKLEGP